MKQYPRYFVHNFCLVRVDEPGGYGYYMLNAGCEPYLGGNREELFDSLVNDKTYEEVLFSEIVLMDRFVGYKL